MRRAVFGCLLMFGAVAGALLLQGGKVHAAACSPSTDYGNVTQSVVVPSSGTYRIWSRIKAPDATNNSYLLQIDGSTCYTVGNNGSMPANTWTWVDYQNGTTTSKIDVALTAGTHAIVMYGNEPDVQLDRVVFTTDTSCVPTGTGDNCANPPDSTPPTVSITAPANNATLSTTTSVTATASDDVAVTKVEFYVDGTLRSTDTASPFSYSLVPSSFSPGSHTITARAYDAANNNTTSAVVTVTIPDTAPPTVSVTAPTASQTISGTFAAAATASDNVGVTKVEFYVDGSLKGTDTTSPFGLSIDTTSLANGSRSFTAKAFDAANNTTTSAVVNATVNNVVTPSDTTPPAVSVSAPSAGAVLSGTSYGLSATASDNVGVTKVEFYVDGSLKGTDTSAPFSMNLNTTTLSNASHSITARAYDAANNATTSPAVSVTVNNGATLPEDINQDGRVNLLDFSLLAAKFGQSGSGLGRADINGDGVVNLLDFSRLAVKFGS